VTEYETRLQSALLLLAPRVDDAPAWGDVVARSATRPGFRWKLGALVLALLVTTGIVAGAFAQGRLHDSLARLSSWAGDQPGEPAPEEQATFDRENAAAYAHFPAGTRVGRLLQAEFDGRRFDLLGFRDGSNLCLRVAPSPVPRHPNPPECVPARELRRLGTPIATVGGHLGARLPGGSGFTMLYGLANDAVSGVEVREGGRRLGSAVVGNNAFFFAGSDHARFPAAGPRVVLRATDDQGAVADVPLETAPMISKVDPEALPGPDRAERVLTNGSIGWLERGEARGEPFTFPDHGPQRIVESRLLQPDPASSFRIGIGFARGTNWQTNGGWYCFTWLWPLIRDSSSSLCTRAESVDSGLVYAGAWMSSGLQFPLWVGLASDDVARIELVHGDGSKVPVPLADNVFSFQTRRGEAIKLVAYDSEDRVVRVEIVGGEGSSMMGYAVAP
jgi:hypothetical protein